MATVAFVRACVWACVGVGVGVWVWVYVQIFDHKKNYFVALKEDKVKWNAQDAHWRNPLIRRKLPIETKGKNVTMRSHTCSRINTFTLLHARTCPSTHGHTRTRACTLTDKPTTAEKGTLLKGTTVLLNAHAPPADSCLTPHTCTHPSSHTHSTQISSNSGKKRTNASDKCGSSWNTCEVSR